MVWNQASIRVAAGWLTVLMVAIIGVCVALVVSSGSNYGAKEPVREYLQALENGDGGKAMGLLRPPPPAGNATLLDGEALKASTAALGGFTIGNPSPSGENRLSVPVSYTVNGTSSTTNFEVEPDGKDWLFYTRWKLVPQALPHVTVQVTNAPEASVNGTPIAIPGGSTLLPVFYPASVSAALNNGYFEATEQHTIVSSPGVSTTLTLHTAATKALSTAVGEQIKKYLDGCAAEATKEQKLQPACPFYHAGLERVTPGTIKWSIATYPEVSIAPFDGQWVVAPLNGTARLTAQAQDLYTGLMGPLEQLHEFSFKVKLTFNKDSVTATPVVEY